jgi:hypothetical protein
MDAESSRSIDSTGGSTVTLKEHESSTKPHESIAVQLTCVVPTGKVEPLAGEQTTLTGPASQASEAAGAAQVTTAAN